MQGLETDTGPNSTGCREGRPRHCGRGARSIHSSILLASVFGGGWLVKGVLPECFRNAFIVNVCKYLLHCVPS